MVGKGMNTLMGSQSGLSEASQRRFFTLTYTKMHGWCFSSFKVYHKQNENADQPGVTCRFLKTKWE